MTAKTLLTIYCAVILVASLAGGVAPLLLKLTHRRLELAVSFVAGVMLGVAMLHLLPHALAEASHTGSLDGVMVMTLAGLLVMFLIERFLCFHHHDAPGGEPCGHTHAGHGDHGHGETHPHEEREGYDGADKSPAPPSPAAANDGRHDVTWSGAALGLSLHTIIAGVALAASVEAQTHLEEPLAWAGLQTFLVIVLHKPFDSLTLGALLARGGWSIAWRHVVNGLFALLIPLGVVLFYLGVRPESIDQSPALAYALAFCAGTFLCIALSDLLPELQFHQHDRIKLTIALFLGLAVAFIASRFESHEGHEREHAATSSLQSEFEVIES